MHRNDGRWTRALFLLLAALLLAAQAEVFAAVKGAEKKPVDAATRSKVVEDILDLSGLKRALESIPAQIEEQMADPDGQFSRLPEGQREQVRNLMLDAFSPQRLVADMRQALAESYRAPLYEAVRARLDSAEGRRLSELEAQLNVPDVQERLRDYSAELESSPATEKRRKLIAQLDQAELSSETILDLTVASFGAVALAAREDLKPLDEKTLQKTLAALRTRLRPAVTDQTAVMLLYACRDVSDSELAGFVRFYRDGNMTAMSRIVRKGFGRTIASSFRDIAKGTRNIRSDMLHT